MIEVDQLVWKWSIFHEKDYLMNMFCDIKKR